MTMNLVEAVRLQVQSDIDAEKLTEERNRFGQYATPTLLAEGILDYAYSLISPKASIRFLDPAFGTGAFYSALLKIFGRKRIQQAIGYEIDKDYGEAATRLWMHERLELSVTDFTTAPLPIEAQKPNLLICNPPYVRHHHISREDKERLRKAVQNITGLRLNGLAGLYCYFLCLCHEWMTEGATAIWLIPSEFMDVNYGKEIKEYLLRHVTLLRIHRFEPQNVQFEDALVSSVVVCFRKQRPQPTHAVEFTYGGTLMLPHISQFVSVAELLKNPKWTHYSSYSRIANDTDDTVRLDDLFTIKRGLATGANAFFIMSQNQAEERGIPPEFLKPILPSPRFLRTNEIEADEYRNPIIDEPLFLLSCNLPEKQVMSLYPELWQYLQEGVRLGINNGYLCSHRNPWYAQEERPPAPFLCTYMGRNKHENVGPFRFILNNSDATAHNVYLLLYPKSSLAEKIAEDNSYRQIVWEALKNIPSEVLTREGRVYGGGLHKVEPRELSNTPISFSIL